MIPDHGPSGGGAAGGPFIRPATAGDAAALADLSAQLGYPTAADRSARRLGAILAADDQAVLVACLADGSLVGWVHVFEALRVESDAFAELGGLVVAEQQRGRGIGRLLLAAAEDWAAARGLPKLRLRSRTTRSAAHGFFERSGFASVKEQCVFDKDVESTA